RRGHPGHQPDCRPGRRRRHPAQPHDHRRARFRHGDRRRHDAGRPRRAQRPGRPVARQPVEPEPGLGRRDRAEWDHLHRHRRHQTVNVDPVKTDQTITVTNGAPAAATYGSSFNVAATSASGLPVTVTVTGGGTYDPTTGAVTMTSGTDNVTVIYTQAGNSAYNA